MLREPLVGKMAASSTRQEEKDDYMSDVFVNLQQDVKPGLIMVRRVKEEILKRERAMELILENKQKSKKEEEKERRETKLQSSLGSENKGFTLLQKMGYKEGHGLGKSGNGIVEPIPLQIKTGRGGIGHEAAQKRKAEEKIEHRKQMSQMKKRAEEFALSEYRLQVRKKKDQLQMEGDLRKSQVACQQLDLQKGIDVPQEAWYWLPTSVDDDDDDDGKEEEEESSGRDYEMFRTTEEKLLILTSYLRRKYFYCVWCAISYQDEEDLSDNCPGDCAADHC
ncbi:G patch domain-containing protein 11 [Rhincodon typus]|uniref:G patch domain-containing protein 11 n=1 Tax=Rhincodon typus TaxID=259920 RepID=UPI0009A41F98|nr:G patch domain-containing protein 11 [Rhincodon typus]